MGHDGRSDELSNYRIHLTVRPVTSLAKDASAAPGRPAGDAERWADKGDPSNQR